MNYPCYIFGASPEFDNVDITIEKDSLIIAVDGGLEVLEKKGIFPNIVIGDFDSLGYVPSSYEVISYEAEKDDTDMMLAIKYGLDKGYSEFRVYGGLGGRLDHTIANIQSLTYIAKQGKRGWLIDNMTSVTVIYSDMIDFDETHKGTISVFALDTEVKGVTITGLKYSLADYSVTNHFPIGVSNEFIGTKSRISADEGSLMIVLSRE